MPLISFNIFCNRNVFTAPSQEIQHAVGRSHTTRRIALGANTLSTLQIRPLFRALTHQTHITSIIISKNNLKDDGMKYLTDAICTMKNLSHLDISFNNITEEGMKIFLQMFEKPTRVNCQALDELILNGNPICDNGFKCIGKLTQHLRLKTLKLNDCNISEKCVDGLKMNLDSIESIDLSNNDVKQVTVSYLMTSLSPNFIVDLELDNIGVLGNVVGCLATFMDTAKDLKIRRLGLSNCKLVDGQFMRIFR